MDITAVNEAEAIDIMAHELKVEISAAVARAEANCATIIHLMGPTCSGKGAVLPVIAREFGDAVGFVEVGKAFREKYPPEYFKGNANPEHCRTEAENMYVDFVGRELKAQRKLIIVDGQPREDQVDFVLRQFPGNKKHFILLHAPERVRVMRAVDRFKYDVASSQLASQRIVRDEVTYYRVLVDLMRENKKVWLFDTDGPLEQWAKNVIHRIANICWKGSL